jgi:DNA-binding CsgD family transcriptional regulator
MKTNRIKDADPTATLIVSESIDYSGLKSLIQSLLTQLNSHTQNINLLEKKLKKVANDLKISNEKQKASLIDNSLITKKTTEPLGSFDLYNSLKQHNLTMREQQTLGYVMQGNTSKQIAKEMGISYRTVEFHMTKLKLKIGVNSRSQLIDKIMNYSRNPN